MLKKILVIGVIAICLIVGLITISKHNIRPTESEPTTAQTEPKPTEDLDIKISDDVEPPQKIVIIRDEDIILESEEDESESNTVEQSEESDTSQSESSTSENAERDITDEDMKQLTSNVEAYTKRQAMEDMRVTAKIEVKKLRDKGNQDFMNITDEMIDNYSDEEVTNLMVKVYQNLSY